MTMSEIEDDLLQRYYDGELSPVEERSVQSRVDRDPDAQQRLRKLARLSECVQEAALEMGREVNSDALFAGISEGIAKDGGKGKPGNFEVIAGEWAEHKQTTWLPLALGGTAAAAALLFVLLSSGGPATQVATDTPPAATVDASTQHSPVKVAEHAPAQPPAGSSVEDVDFGDNAGTVFEIETRGITTAVVWITDEGEEAGP